MLRIVLHIDAVHQHFALRRVIEPGDQIDDGGFSAAGTADDADRLSFLNQEVDIAQRLFPRILIRHAEASGQEK